MDAVDVNAFIDEIEHDITQLKIVNQHVRERRFKKIEAERTRNVRQKQEELKQKLKNKINEFNHIPKEFGKAFNDLIEGDWGLHGKRFKELIAPIELGTGDVYSFSFLNHYRTLEKEEDKQGLVDLYNEKIATASTEDLSEYMDYVQVDFQIPLTEGEKEKVLLHFKTLLTTFVKGYILQDNVHYYAYEAVPSILAIIEMSQPTSLFSFPLFEYNPHPKMEETAWQYTQELRSWYQQKGKGITCFEVLVEEEVSQNNYEGASHYYKTYRYLFEEESRIKQEQALLSLLYQKYIEAKQEKETFKQENDLMMIRNELLFQFR